MTTHQTHPLRPEAERVTTRGQWRVSLHRDVFALQDLFIHFERWGELTAFQSFGWVSTLAAAVRASGRGEPLFLVVDRDDFGPMLLLPLVRQRQRNLSRVTFLDFGVSDYNAPLLMPHAPLHPSETYELWRAIRAALPASDLVFFDKMPIAVGRQDNPIVRLDGAERMALTSAAIRLGRPWAEHRATLWCPKFRTDLDGKWRRLKKRADCRLEVAAGLRIEEIFDALVEQRRERFEVLGRHNILIDPVWRGFYRDLLDLEPPHDVARLFALRIDGEVIATLYGIVHGKAFHALLPTFRDGSWRNYSPGMQLFSLVMDWSIEQGLDVFDFTIGAERYKSQFGVTTFPLAEYVSASTAVGLPVMAAARGRAFVRSRPRLAAALKRVAGRP